MGLDAIFHFCFISIEIMIHFLRIFVFSFPISIMIKQITELLLKAGFILFKEFKIFSFANFLVFHVQFAKLSMLILYGIRFQNII